MTTYKIAIERTGKLIANGLSLNDARSDLRRDFGQEIYNEKTGLPLGAKRGGVCLCGKPKERSHRLCPECIWNCDGYCWK